MYQMILNVIIFKNKKIDAFTQPQFTDVEPEKAAIQLSRSLLLNEDIKTDNTYKNLDMYVIGVFDDQTGEFRQEEVRKILDCGQVISSRNKKEGKDDVPSIPANR